jgi:hypothetical protein
MDPFGDWVSIYPKKRQKKRNQLCCRKLSATLDVKAYGSRRSFYYVLMTIILAFFYGNRR